MQALVQGVPTHILPLDGLGQNGAAVVQHSDPHVYSGRNPMEAGCVTHTMKGEDDL